MCSKSKQMVPINPMRSPMVFLIFMSPYSHHTGHHRQSFVTKNGQKTTKTTNSSYSFYLVYKCVLRANKWCPVILWCHPWYLLPSWPHIVTPWPKKPHGQKTTKTMNSRYSFYLVYKCVLRANKWCPVILWCHPWYPPPSRPHIVTPWANID